MLINLVEILKIAEEKKCAVGAFNTPGTESLWAVIGAAEKLNVPVILMHAQVHEEYAPLAKIGPVMVQAAKAARVPVCVHLDHGESLDYLAQALEIGFTGIMYDGSTLPYDENLKNTRKAVAMAHALSWARWLPGKAESRAAGRFIRILRKRWNSAGRQGSTPWRLPSERLMASIRTSPCWIWSGSGSFRSGPGSRWSCTAAAAYRRRITGKASPVACGRSTITAIWPGQESPR